VYCSTCLETTAVRSDAFFVCSNPACPAPYSFKTYATEIEARDAYNSLESWLPKFYFQPGLHGSKAPYWCVAGRNDPMHPFLPNSITELIDPERLRLLEIGLSKDIDGPLLIVDPNGRRLEDVRESKLGNTSITIPFLCQKYCEYIRSFGLSKPPCEAFDQEIAQTLLRGNPIPDQIGFRTFDFHGSQIQAIAYICWAGLIDLVFPMQINGKTMAFIFAGQKQLRESRPLGVSLKERILRTADILGADQDRLLAFARESPCVSINHIQDQSLPELFDAVRNGILESLYTIYCRKREEREDFFVREIVHHLQMQKETRFGIRKVDLILSRLREFFRINEAYFLINDIEKLDQYQIVSKASSEVLSSAENSFRIKLNIEKLGITDRISVFQITNKERYRDVVEHIKSALSATGNRFDSVWVGTCPLSGASNAFWLFVDPKPCPPVRNSPELNRLDRNFLSRFCVSARDALNAALATSLVMRSISHELGSEIQSIFSREAEIAQGTVKGEQAKTYARRNLAQLHHYHGLLENIRAMFIRRSRQSYRFRTEDLRSMIADICESFQDAPDMLVKHVELQKPSLAGNTLIEMDESMLKVAFFNLIQNAVKYSFEKHYVEISGREQAARKGYEIQIANFGVGILQEEIDRRLIFLEDYRGILSRDRYRTGTGLGLPITERIIANHRGIINVKSIPAPEMGKKRHLSRLVPDPADFFNSDDELNFGFLNIFSVFLPISQATEGV
jgi:signal transduction histidine kinase